MKLTLQEFITKESIIFNRKPIYTKVSDMNTLGDS